MQNMQCVCSIVRCGHARSNGQVDRFWGRSQPRRWDQHPSVGLRRSLDMVSSDKAAVHDE